MAEKIKADCAADEKITAEKQCLEFAKKHSEKEFESHIVKKYFVLGERMLSVIDKFSRLVHGFKIVAAVLFLAFTAVAVFAGNHSGSKMLWFSLWILLIFILIFIFLIADYVKNVSLKRLLFFLENVEETEFKDFDDDLTEDEE